jgi:hypothetical protein
MQTPNSKLRTSNFELRTWNLARGGRAARDVRAEVDAVRRAVGRLGRALAKARSARRRVRRSVAAHGAREMAGGAVIGVYERRLANAVGAMIVLDDRRGALAVERRMAGRNRARRGKQHRG